MDRRVGGWEGGEEEQGEVGKGGRDLGSLPSPSVSLLAFVEEKHVNSVSFSFQMLKCFRPVQVTQALEKVSLGPLRTQ